MAKSVYLSINPNAENVSMTTEDFPGEMRDRQARGKDPYGSDSEISDYFPEPGNDDNSHGGSSLATGPSHRVGSPKPEETFAVQERRRMASQILNSPELLMMAALRDSMSIPAARLKYTRIRCGLGEQQQHQQQQQRQQRQPSGGLGSGVGRSGVGVGGVGAQQQRKRGQQS